MAAASETPKMAFAPNFDLFSVPSSSIIILSIAVWANMLTPCNSSAIEVFMLFTAFKTPLPRYLFLSLSRNSTASCAPVDAPDGTAARPKIPLLVITSTSTVGLPLESRISLARIAAIVLISSYSIEN
ncbi:MAG: hypothetical protein BWY67_01244 [Bacteroidetes bacterium ADurb.Bin397]|nr:MAG: hypothetical protein BWY67_01244 [Bacteroidetes bacterium ADurb.Bin397]